MSTPTLVPAFRATVTPLLPDHPDAPILLDLLLNAPARQPRDTDPATLLRVAHAVALLLIARKLEARILDLLDQPDRTLPPAALIRSVAELGAQASLLLDEALVPVSESPSTAGEPLSQPTDSTREIQPSDPPAVSRSPSAVAPEVQSRVAQPIPPNQIQGPRPGHHPPSPP
ncbi:MAG: hypothetical protein KBH78_00925 [Candidatus Hydrogenedentes bacterium]|nr:hypothetical protein [Candidatus Hydrogenedentota bacterium]